MGKVQGPFFFTSLGHFVLTVSALLSPLLCIVYWKASLQNHPDLKFCSPKAFIRLTIGDFKYRPSRYICS